MHRRQRRSIRLKGYDYSQCGAYFVTICTKDRAFYFQDTLLQEIVQFAWERLTTYFPNIILDAIVVMPNHVHFIVWLALEAEDVSPADRGMMNHAPTDEPPYNNALVATPVGASFDDAPGQRAEGVSPADRGVMNHAPTDEPPYNDALAATPVGASFDDAPGQGNVPTNDGLISATPVGASFDDAPGLGGNGRRLQRPKYDRQSPALGEVVRTFKALVTRRIHQSAGPASFAWQANYYEHVVRSQKSLDVIRNYIENNPYHWEFDRYNPSSKQKDPQAVLVWKLLKTEAKENRLD